MQGLVNRFSWNNLPLRVKTTVIFLSQIALVTLMAGTGFIALGSIGSAVSQTIGTIIELRSASNDIQLRIDEMSRIEDSLSASFLQTDFDLTQINTPRQHQLLAAELKVDTNHVQVLSQHLGGVIAPTTFNLQVTDVQTNVDKSQERLNRLLEPITELTTPKTGALPLLRTFGRRLQEQTLALGDPDLNAQLVTISSLETAMVTQHPTDQQRVAIHNAISAYILLYSAKIIPFENQHDEIGTARLYDQQVDKVYDLLKQVETEANGTQAQIVNLRSSGSRLGTLVETQTAAPLDTLAAVIGQSRLILSLGLVIAIIAGSVVTAFFNQSLNQSVNSLLATARRLQAGDLRARVNVRGRDEFNELGGAFNAMAVQMDGLVSGLEQRVAERARDLSITADIGRAVVTLPDPRDLMNEIVELIRQRFGFYHAQVFLVDDAGQNAVLVASTGTAGRELLSRRHTLAVGSQSVIGQVTSRAEPVIASDTDLSPIHQRNELLPDTRSEMALPMRIGDRVIGALDVQSVAPNAFEVDSVAVFQIMADQLAVALENSRLFAKLQAAERNLDIFQQRVTREAWNVYQGNRDPNAPAAFRMADEKLEPHQGAAPTALAEAIQSGRLITAEEDNDEFGLAIPIRVRGEVIGAFGFGGETVQNLSEEDIALVEAVVDRVGLALENLRLVEQTARRAEHEQVVNEITSKIVGSTDINFILQTTVKELGRVLRAPQTSVQLRRERTDTGHE